MDTENTVCMLTGDEMVEHFVEKEFLPEGQDEYYLRNAQTTKPIGGWRHLRSDEIDGIGLFALFGECLA